MLQRGRHVVGRCRPLAFEVGGVVAGSGSGEARPVVGRRRTVVVHRCRRRVVGSPVGGESLIMLILNIASLLLLGRSWATKQFHKRNETHFTVTRIRWRTPLRQFRERTVGRWRRFHWPRLLAVNSSSRRWPRKWPPIGEEPPLSLSERNNFIAYYSQIFS